MKLILAISFALLTPHFAFAAGQDCSGNPKRVDRHTRSNASVAAAQALPAAGQDAPAKKGRSLQIKGG